MLEKVEKGGVLWVLEEWNTKGRRARSARRIRRAKESRKAGKNKRLKSSTRVKSTRRLTPGIRLSLFRSSSARIKWGIIS